MSDDISNPLLSLVKEQGLIDDLQYEEVLGEFKRTGKPVIQILQDFGDPGPGHHPAGHRQSSGRAGGHRCASAT